VKGIERRIQKLEERLTPPMTEELTLIIIGVKPDGQKVDSGMRFTIPGIPKNRKKRWWPT
jgi:hypothetical protein